MKFHLYRRPYNVGMGWRKWRTVEADTLTGCERTVLRARIGRAIESLKAAERFDLRPMGNFLGDGMVRDDKYGEWTEAEILDKVLGILQGDSNE